MSPTILTFGAGSIRGFSSGSNITNYSVTLNNTYTTTTALTTSYSFNYGSSVSAGTMVAIVVTVRSASAADITAVSDSAGNAFTEAIQGTQSNALTVSAIYYAKLTAGVTTATTITVSLSAVTYDYAQHATIFVLNGVASFGSAAQASTSASASVTNSVSPVGTQGIVIHGISTGTNPAPTVTSVSTNWVSQSSLRVNLCSQYTATLVSSLLSSPTTDTFTMSGSANYAGVIAHFY